jgi:sulfur carrier protein
MKITINGAIENIPETQLSISRLLEIREVESPEMVSVQLNGTIVERAHYGETTVADNDEVDFLYFMGGGSHS